MISNHDFTFDAYWGAVDDITLRMRGVPSSGHRQVRSVRPMVEAFLAGDYRRACDALRWSGSHQTMPHTTGAHTRSVAGALLESAAVWMEQDVWAYRTVPHSAVGAARSRRSALPLTQEDYEAAVGQAYTYAMRRLTEEEQLDWIYIEIPRHPFFIGGMGQALSVLEYTGSLEHLFGYCASDDAYDQLCADGYAWATHGRDIEAGVKQAAVLAMCGDVAHLVASQAVAGMPRTPNLTPNHDFTFDVYWREVDWMGHQPVDAGYRLVQSFIHKDHQRACDALRWTAEFPSFIDAPWPTLAEYLVEAGETAMLHDIGNQRRDRTTVARARGLADRFQLTHEEYEDAVSRLAERAAQQLASPDPGARRVVATDEEARAEHEVMVDGWLQRQMEKHPLVAYGGSAAFPQRNGRALSVLEYTGDIEGWRALTGGWSVFRRQVEHELHDERIGQLIHVAARACMSADVLRLVHPYLAAAYTPNVLGPAIVEERLLAGSHPLHGRRAMYPTWTPEGRVRLEVLGEGGCPVGTLFLEPPQGRRCDWDVHEFDGRRVAKLSRTSVRLKRILAAADRNAA